MKFVKRGIYIIVLAFAAYGVFALLKKPPRLDVPPEEARYLQGIGVSVGNGQPSEGGLSGVFNNVEGAPPIEAVYQPIPPKTFSAPPAAFSETPPLFFDGGSEKVAAPVFDENIDAPVFDGNASQPEIPAEGETAPLNTLPQDAAPDSPLPAPGHPFPPNPIRAASNEISYTNIPAESWDGPAVEVPSADVYYPPPHTAILPQPSSPIPLSNSVRFIPQDTHQQLNGTAAPHGPEKFPHNNTPANVLPIAPAVYPAATSDIQQTDYANENQNEKQQDIGFGPPRLETNRNVPTVSFAPPRKITTEGKIASMNHHNVPQVHDVPQVFSDAVVVPVSTAAVTQKSVPLKESKLEVKGVRDITAQFITKQQSEISSGHPENIRRAYVELSKLWDSKELTADEVGILLPVLDTLALKVIYSKDTNILEKPHLVQNGETIENIAAQYSITPEFLWKVNGLVPGQQPAAGTLLKVVHGRFDAVVSAKQRTLFLLLGGLYAGRFPMTIGQQVPTGPAEFYVVTKSAGNKVLMLNNNVAVGGSEVLTAGMCIRLNDTEIREVFDILSEQSVVVFE